MEDTFTVSTTDGGRADETGVAGCTTISGGALVTGGAHLTRSESATHIGVVRESGMASGYPTFQPRRIDGVTGHLEK
jgi:hypothetical protein